MWKGFIATLALLLGGVAAAQTAPEYGEFPADHERIVREHYELELVDPESVRYRAISQPMPVEWDNHYEGLGYQVCVTFNARNRAGGYQGWRTHALLIRDGEVRDWVGVTRAIIGGDRGCPPEQVLD
ncbi:MAG: hypothetical protein GC206_04015 [Alphaproteobacteria bacterium]|nr:hypothetical protein [Alphaproteobacteria bacterium]